MQSPCHKVSIGTNTSLDKFATNTSFNDKNRNKCPLPRY